MRTMCLLMLTILLIACSADKQDDGAAAGADPNTHSEADTDTDTDADPETFELIGSWEYSGGFPGLTDHMDVGEDEIDNTGDYNGTD
jgi:hypothetical protein